MLHSSTFVFRRAAMLGDAIDRKTEANGTGPFVLEDWKQGDSITLKRNDAYWGTRPHWERVQFRMISNNAARVAALDLLAAQAHGLHHVAHVLLDLEIRPRHREELLPRLQDGRHHVL